jgi:hypothetical protein
VRSLRNVHCALITNDGTAIYARLTIKRECEEDGLVFDDTTYVCLKAAHGAVSFAEVADVDPIADGASCAFPAACAAETPVNIASRNRNARIIISVTCSYIVTR